MLIVAALLPQAAFSPDGQLRAEDAKVYEAGLLAYAKPEEAYKNRLELRFPSSNLHTDPTIYVVDHSGPNLALIPPSEKVDDQGRTIPKDPDLWNAAVVRNRQSESLTWFHPVSKWLKVVSEKDRARLRREDRMRLICSIGKPGYSLKGDRATLRFSYMGLCIRLSQRFTFARLMVSGL